MKQHRFPEEPRPFTFLHSSGPYQLAISWQGATYAAIARKSTTTATGFESTGVMCHPHFAISISGVGEAVHRVSAAGDSHREKDQREDVRMGQMEEGLHIHRTAVHSQAVGVHPG